MFKRLRIALLLYVLLFVAVGQFLTARRSTDWDVPLAVDVYPVNGDGSASVQKYLDNLGPAEFDGIEIFFAAEARRYGVPLDRPIRILLAAQYSDALPPLAPDASMLGILSWSLRMRWLTERLQWRSDAPRADIVVFAVFHDAADAAALDRSTALEKGLIAVVNLFAERTARGTNQVVFAHEVLHTLGATDKYDLRDNAPRYPDGYAEPNAQPRLPQSKAELMAGRIPLDEHRAEIPENLRQVLVGAATAKEIGWRRD